MAPEIQKGERYGEKGDLWSIGIILFELLAGFPPFTGKNKLELKYNIDKGYYKMPPDVKVSVICLDLIQKLLIADVNHRLSW
jgi:serine/threonine protein kinase